MADGIVNGMANELRNRRDKIFVTLALAGTFIGGGVSGWYLNNFVTWAMAPIHKAVDKYDKTVEKIDKATDTVNKAKDDVMNLPGTITSKIGDIFKSKAGNADKAETLTKTDVTPVPADVKPAAVPCGTWDIKCKWETR